MRQYFTARIAVALVVAASLQFTYKIAWADEPSVPVVLEDVAGRMVEGCVEFARQQDMQPISIAIVNKAGSMILFRRQPGANATSGEVALLKARSSARTGVPTSALLTEDAAVRDLFLLLKLTQIAGGVPVITDGKTIGAIGVSGELPISDAECAYHAIKAIETSTDD